MKVPRIYNEPIEINWAGWETDTLRLQQAGWSLSADQDVMGRRLRIAMRHEDWRCYGVAEVEYDYLYSMEKMSRPSLQMQARLANQLHVVDVHQVCSGFKPIDATPMYGYQQTVGPLEDFVHFAPPLVRTKEIVVPEPSVNDLLEQILKLQEPEKNRYFKQLVDEDRRPQHKFHAQIVSLVA